MKRMRLEREETNGPMDPARRRLVLAVPAVLAGAWWMGHIGPVGTLPGGLAGTGPRVLPLVLADLYGPHDLAG